MILKSSRGTGGIYTDLLPELHPHWWHIARTRLSPAAVYAVSAVHVEVGSSAEWGFWL